MRHRNSSDRLKNTEDPFSCEMLREEQNELFGIINRNVVF